MKQPMMKVLLHGCYNAESGLLMGVVMGNDYEAHCEGQTNQV